MNNFVRIAVMVITFLFGGFTSVFYIAAEIAVIANRDNMEGYFNAIGMIFVVFAFVLILTNIPSIICQIKIMVFRQKMVATENIDEDYSNKEHHAWKSMPSKFLRSANLIFAFAIVGNFLYGLFHLLIVEGSDNSPGFTIVLVLSFSLLLCGIVLSVDALKIRKKARELREIHGN